MAINVNLRGEGDMKTSTYDPDKDGEIAVAQTEADMKKSVYDTDDDDVVNGTGIGEFIQANILKVVSDTLRVSHDAEDGSHHYDEYTKMKTITFTEGICGVLRVKFDLAQAANYQAGDIVYGRVYKNGVAIGGEKTREEQTYETFSEDIDVGDMPANETLELWCWINNSENISIRNFRLYFDNESIIVPPSTNT